MNIRLYWVLSGNVMNDGVKTLPCSLSTIRKVGYPNFIPFSTSLDNCISKAFSHDIY